MDNFTPELKEQFKEYERERYRKYYREYLAVKVQCPICGKEVSNGWLEKHQESRLCKPIGLTKTVRDFTEKDMAKREWHREYARAWKER